MVGFNHRLKVQRPVFGSFDMGKLSLFISILLSLFSVDALSLSCEGDFKQKIVVDGEEWLWKYDAKGYSISGETLLHTERNSFSIIATENENCFKNASCSTNYLACAISFALNEASSQKMSIGRMQITSYGLYSKARATVESVSECRDAYSQYYSVISEYWKNNLTVHPYVVNKIHPREIKLDKPTNHGDNCFTSPAWKPVPWSGIDYFPVITIERRLD